MRLLSPVVVGAVLWLAPSAAVFAVGVGGLKLESALNEPLRATVPVHGLTEAERSSLRVRLASRADSQAAGVGHTELLTALEFSLEQVDGEDVIRITSEQPIPEPYLHFLIELDWSGGRLLREYTALLDPPLYAEQQARPVTAPVSAPPPPAPVAIPEPAAPAPQEPAAVAAAPAAPAAAAETPPASAAEGPLGPSEIRQGRSDVFDVGPAAGEAAAAPVASAGQVGPTRPGDTLWRIARDLKGQLGANEFQIMAALVRENPGAFIDGNMNLLKRGEILSVPAAETVRGIETAQAAADYTAQLDAWEQYRQRLASAAPVVAPAEGEREAAAQADTEPGAARTAQAEPAASGSELLRIVQASADAEAQGGQTEAAGSAGPGGTGTDAASDAELAAMRSRLATLEEDVVTKESENSELRERVRMLEEQVSQAQRLIRIQEENLALAQHQAEQAAQAAETQAAAAPTQAAAEPARPAAPEPAPAVQQPAQSQPAQQPSAPAAAAPATPAAAKPAPAKPAAQPAPAKARVVQPAPEKGLLDTITGFVSGWISTVGLGIAVVLLGVVGLWFYRRRQSIAEFEESILSGSALDSRPNTADTSDEAPGTDTSFLSDFGVPGMGSMHADEVDPLAEAEVYLAYGRSEQAEDVLKEAITRSPERPELKLKLLEIYQQRGDVKGFETFAEEMYPAMGEDKDNIWPRIAAMGRKMNPGNPLFRVEAAAAAGAAAGADELAVPTPPDALEPFPEPEPDEGLEFDLDEFMEEEAGGSAAPAKSAAGAAHEFAADESPPTGRGPASAGAGAGSAAELEGFELLDDAAEPQMLSMDDTSELEKTAGGGARPQAALDFDTETTGELETEPRLDLDEMPGDEALEFEFEESTEESSGQPALGDTDRMAVAAREDDTLTGGAAVARTQKLPALDDTAFTLGDQLQEGELEWDAEETGGGSDLDFDAGELELAEPQELRAGRGEPAPAGAPAAAQDDGGQVDWDETATKLDLARAYIDMGDEAGARSILDEVLEEGNDAQRRQAQELASQLSASA